MLVPYPNDIASFTSHLYVPAGESPHHLCNFDVPLGIKISGSSLDAAYPFCVF